MNRPSALPLRCWAEIDLAALERNLRLIRQALPPRIRYVAVVKADAYGHGIYQTVARLMHSGADLFAVATIAEAAAVRELGPGWPILVLSALLPEEDRYVLEYELTPTISTAEEVARLDALGRSAARRIPVHLKIDTGMGRLGVWHEQALPLYQELLAAPNLQLAGIFTHFSSADTDPEFTALQRQIFLETLNSLPDLQPASLLIHADNSAGIETFSRESPFNAVRVGLLQFGIHPYARSLLARVRPEPVFSFRTRVALVKELPAGTSISYGRTWTLQRPSRVAVLAAGYGDGIPRACSNRASALIRGRRCPFIGRVTMDQTIVDVTDLPESPACGDEAVLVGEQAPEQISIVEFSDWAETIPWETLTSVTKRVPRVYRTSLGL
jgi:alanine racemase